MSSPQGADKADWVHFDLVLGLGLDLLPVVPDAKATPGPFSRIKEFGKIPSSYDSEGMANGLKDWQNRTVSPADVARWSEDRRLSMCLRTGRSGVYAIDVDITDAESASTFYALIHQVAGGLFLPERARADSSKFLLAFRLNDKTLKKRIIRVEHGIIEFLGAGQQFVCAGDHPRGSRYEWRGGLPDEIPTLDVEGFESIWTALSAFSVKPERAERDAGPDLYGDGESILSALTETEANDLCDALKWKPLREAAGDQSCWAEIGYALLSLGALGFDLFVTFSEFAANYEPGAPQAWWDQHATQIPRSDFRHIFTMARNLGWRAATRADITTFEPVKDPDPYADLIGEDDKTLQHDPTKMGDVPDPKFLTTDLANARRIRQLFNGDLIASPDGRFFLWAGTHWEPDETIANRYSLRLSNIIEGEINAYKERMNGILELQGEEFRKAYKEAKLASNKGTSLKVKQFKEDKQGETVWKLADLVAGLRKWQKKCEMEYTQAAAVRELRKGLAGENPV